MRFRLAKKSLGGNSTIDFYKSLLLFHPCNVGERNEETNDTVREDYYASHDPIFAFSFGIHQLSFSDNYVSTCHDFIRKIILIRRVLPGSKWCIHNVFFFFFIYKYIHERISCKINLQDRPFIGTGKTFMRCFLKKPEILNLLLINDQFGKKSLCICWLSRITTLECTFLTLLI